MGNKLINDFKGNTKGLLGSIGEIAAAGANDIFDMTNKITGDDIQDKKNNYISSINSAQFGPISTSNFDELSGMWSSYKPISDISKKQLGQTSWAQDVGNGIMQSIEGANAGIGLGGLGAIIGGVGGAATSAIGSIFQRKNIKKAQRDINNAVHSTNIFNARALEEASQQAREAQITNLERQALSPTNIAALGGNLSVINKGRSINMNRKAYGGELHSNGGEFTNGLLSVNNGGTHEENPNEGVPMGIDPQGVPNLVEEGETVFNDYVFSKRLTIPKDFAKKYKLNSNLSFAEASKKLAKESEERPNDPLSTRSLNYMMTELAVTQEEVRQLANSGNKMAFGGNKYSGTEDNATQLEKRNKELNTSLRYAPIASNIFDLAYTLGDQPNIQEINETLGRPSSSPRIGVAPLGDYMSYRPADINYLNAKAAAANEATRRSIINTSSGNRGVAQAAMLAADKNYLNTLGDNYLKIAENNLAQRRMVDDFNRQTNMYNNQLSLQSQQANMQAAQQDWQNQFARNNAALQYSQLERQRYRDQLSGSIRGLMENFGTIGQENFDINMANAVSPLYKVNTDGSMSFSKDFWNLDNSKKLEILNSIDNKKD